MKIENKLFLIVTCFKAAIILMIILISESAQTQPVISVIEGYLELKDIPDTTSIYLGRKSGLETSIGFLSNTLLGSYTGRKGSINTVAGSSTGRLLIGTGNAILGSYSGQNIQVNQNSVFGYLAGINISMGNSNVCFGTSSGAQISSGGSNICLGYYSGPALANAGLSVD